MNSYKKYIFIALTGVSSLLLADADNSTISSKAAVQASQTLDIVKVFNGCPLIYIALITMSIIACAIWLYSMFTLRLSMMMPTAFIDYISTLLKEKNYDKALELCQNDPNFFSGIVASGLVGRKHGAQVMMDVMHAEGKRRGHALWQRLSLLSEIAALAPMLGLLGTVIGLFFAFYESSQSAESMNAIFDGLGIAVGTTVVGLIVAIMSMLFYTILKFRLVHLLSVIETESQVLVMLHPGDRAA